MLTLHAPRLAESAYSELATASRYTKSVTAEKSREIGTSVESNYGGGSETGSGTSRAGNTGRSESCAQNGKWITSFAAIVAPHTCDCGQGRVRCANTGASRYVTLLVSCDRLCAGNDPTCIS